MSSSQSNNDVSPSAAPANARAAAPSDAGAKAMRWVVRFFSAEWSGALLAVVLMAISIEVFTAGKPFFHPSNLLTIFNNAAALGIVAAGMTLVILTAGIDLSVGSLMGMSAALVGYVASYWGFDPVLSILFGIAMGCAVGLLHGSLVAQFGMPAFIVTLAGLSIWRGTGHLSTGAQATPKLDDVFNYFGRFNPFSPIRQAYKADTLPDWLSWLGALVDSQWLDWLRTFQMSTVILFSFYIVLAILMSNTKLGLYVYAIGSNEKGSRQAGINVKLYKILAYVFCSFCAAFAAILFLGRAPYAKSDYGMMWELDAIAAVVIGGTSLFGGRGSIWGTLLGVLLLKLINNGLTLAQLNTFWQMIVTGLIILIAVGLDIVRQNKNPLRVRQMLIAAAAALAFFAFVTPGSKVVSSWIVHTEHKATVALQEELAPQFKQPAPKQMQRLQTPETLQTYADAAQDSALPAMLFGALSLGAVIMVFLAAPILIYGLMAAYGVALVLALALGLGTVAPFLVLAMVLLAGTMVVDPLFRRAASLR